MKTIRSHAAVLVLLVLTSCATDSKRIQSALRSAITATDAAQVAFVTFDERRQAEIVSVAVTKEEAEVKIAAYRGRRQPVLLAFTSAYSALAAAAALAPLVDAGKRDSAHLWQAIGEAASATLAAQAALAALRKDPP
jgi:hypothetical protein